MELCSIFLCTREIGGPGGTHTQKGSSRQPSYARARAQSAIVNFCREYLWGMKIQGIDLSKSPGIVDLIIWYHCADPPDGFSICSVKPKCLEKEDICPLSRGCLFFTMKTERNASK